MTILLHKLSELQYVIAYNECVLNLKFSTAMIFVCLLESENKNKIMQHLWSTTKSLQKGTVVQLWNHKKVAKNDNWLDDLAVYFFE